MRKKLIYTYDKKENAFELETNPSFLDIIAIIQETADAVISDIVGYAPYMTEYMIRYNMIHELTDVVLPEELNDCYRFIEDSDIWFVMIQDISELYMFVEENVNKIIKFRKQQLLSQSKIDDAATHLLTTISKEFEGLDIKEVLERLEKAGLNPNLSEEKVVKAILGYQKEENAKSAKSNSV